MCASRRAQLDLCPESVTTGHAEYSKEGWSTSS